jgi:hypothetical protein
MKMNKRLACVILLLSTIAIEVIWCLTMYLAIGIIPFLGVVSDLMPKENSCLSSLPPASFSKANLVGTWVARRLGDSDTLIIREDGTYKQIIHLDIPAVDYEITRAAFRIFI